MRKGNKGRKPFDNSGAPFRVRVRRANDNVEKDCFSNEEIAAFLNGFAGYSVILYDHNRNRRKRTAAKHLKSNS